MSTVRPTTDELNYWESILNPGRKPSEATATYYQVTFDPNMPDPSGPAVPAQPVRNGGAFWRDRIFINDVRQERKKRQPVEHICPECGTQFRGTARAVYCGDKCGTRVRVRRFKATQRVTPNLPIHSEEGKAQ